MTRGEGKPLSTPNGDKKSSVSVNTISKPSKSGSDKKTKAYTSPGILEKLQSLREKLDSDQVIIFDMIKLLYEDQVKSDWGEGRT